MNTELNRFETELREALAAGTFVKLSAGNYQGLQSVLKQLHVRKVKLKGVDHLSITYRYKTKDEVKNEETVKGISLVISFLKEDFKIATLFTTHKEIQFEVLKNGRAVLREREIAAAPAAEGHDRKKSRSIDAKGNKYLHLLGVTDADGNILKNAQDKYKQINHYVDLLAPLLKDAKGKIKHIADMGSGKGYLTFALYDFLTNTLQADVMVEGIEFRPELVTLCNRIAEDSGFEKLNFIEGTIEHYEADKIDLLIALHACDTATDDAIFKGIKANAKLIVVAPCCHKQIRKEMEKSRPVNEVSFLTRHGIFMERQAEMVTDGLRALLLEYAGYKVKVMQFVADAHTPKNVMIVGVKRELSDELSEEKRANVLASIKDTKSFFGIDYHYLERLLGV